MFQNKICIIINGIIAANQVSLDVGQEDTSVVDDYNASSIYTALDHDIGKHDVHTDHGDHLELLEVVWNVLL